MAGASNHACVRPLHYSGRATVILTTGEDRKCDCHAATADSVEDYEDTSLENIAQSQELSKLIRKVSL